MATVRAWLAARRPLWAIYPTRRLAVAVLVLSILWLLPGTAAIGTAVTALAALAIAAGIDYVLLPGRNDVAVTRDIPATIGLGDVLDANLVVESRWGRSARG